MVQYMYKRINMVRPESNLCLIQLPGALHDGVSGDKEIPVKIRSNSHYRN